MKERMNAFRETLNFVCSVQFLRMAFLWTFQVVYSYFSLHFLEFFSRSSPSYPRCHPMQNNISKKRRPVCVITGATSGLGAAAAHALSREGFYVVLAGRSRDFLSKTVVELQQIDPDACVKAFEVDLSSFQSMVNFKTSLQKWLFESDMHLSVQLLINNAGILATSHRCTVEGYDQMMGTNYIGAFVLTNLLLPLLKDSFIPSRVVNVTSFTHRCVSKVQIEDETLFGSSSLHKTYPCAQVYESAKFCLVLFTYELNRQLNLVAGSTQVSVMAADPGAVATNIMRELPSHLSFLALTALKLFGLLQSPEDGVNSIIDAALAPPEVSGAYFFGGRGRTLSSSSLSYDVKLAEKLWSRSCNLFLPKLHSYTEL